MTSGFSVAFLGIDGIGKSTLCRAFEEELKAAGHEVVSVSWRSALSSTSEPWPAVPLQQLWLESFRALYGAGRREGRAVEIPRGYDMWESLGCEADLASAPVDGNRAAGALAAAFVELSGNVILAAEVIKPALDRGAVVVQESYPLKHVLKELAVADRLAHEARPTEPSAAAVADLSRVLRGALDAVFGSQLLIPDVGILVDGPAAYAYRWRTAQNGAIGALEDFGAAGERSEESFRLLQEETAKLFREYAESWGWLHHRVDDTGLEANLRRGLDTLRAHPLIAERLAAR
ncbi:hypothetical protein ABH940_003484 [Streptacidiphilus sp. BW17]|uniref:hypothetical protein n=1 Tax=Streptacidiphilus sp. BW17 TaxID=3156274 RepID=UPI003517965F